MNLILCKSGCTQIGFRPDTGLPLSLKNAKSGLEYLKDVSQPFFRLEGYIQGQSVCLTAEDAVTAGVHINDACVSLYYNFLGEYDVCVRCDVQPGTDGLLRFDITVQQQAMEVCKIEYPLFLIRDTLETPEADWLLCMHPFENGMLIHGFENALTEIPRAFSDSSVCNPAQMAACGCSSEQFYLTTADTAHHARQLIPVWKNGSLHMSAMYWPDDRFCDEIALPYEAKAGILMDGEWYASAEAFRSWSNAQAWAKNRLTERKDTPKWWLNSPVVVAIKEQGKRNSELAQKTSPWCHPLEKGIPRILEIAEKIDSPVNVQVFHWEKGGGFVNGDHFPPLSGFEGTAKFFQMLHENGHTGGVYIIPHKWTFKAHTTGFDPSPFLFDKKTAKNAVLRRNGTPAFSRPWDWEWRKRVCVCIAEEAPRRELIDTFRAFSEMGADYIQFDTFCGVTPTCYNPAHSHPSGNGSWQVDTTLSILRELRSFPRDFVLTFEAQPIPDIVPLSHGFVERGLHPKNQKGVEMIPLYQFLYHPYTQGFCGENCGDFNTPDNFFYANAITWISGDLTMISLDMRGDICMQTHEVDAYNQTVNTVYPDEEVYEFLRKISHMRRTTARKYLSEGEMLRAPKIHCASAGTLLGNGFTQEIPSILGSAWRAADGASAAVFINHTGQEQELCACLRTSAKKAQLTTNDDQTLEVNLQNGAFRFVMPKRSTILVEY